MSVDITKMDRYASPVNPALYPQLTILLLGIGLFFTAWFFVYEVDMSKRAKMGRKRSESEDAKVTSTKGTRNISKELLVSAVAALFLGFGTVFLMLWVGIYV